MGRAIALILLLSGCKIDCSNLPVKREIILLPISIEKPCKAAAIQRELDACEHEVNQWRESAWEHQTEW